MEVFNVVEAAVALFMVTLAATVVIMTALAAGALAALVTIRALGIAEGVPPDDPLLAVLASTPTPVIIVIILQAGSLASTTEFMLDINLMLIFATL
ncbi:hypothetical protein [Pseudomonas sp. GM48]|uniref:hypothetical protein n=1 Tax=Pseudomonas sp. GM48 TaxID=1144330 RepID=UPI0012FA824E|nr:hypothetical protein [Pseudomonas sp. GM48]